MSNSTEKSSTATAVGPDAASTPASFGPGTLSRDALSSLLYSGAVRLGTAGLSIAAARILGTSGAGALGVALQVVALATLVACFSLPYALAQHLSRSGSARLRRRLIRVSAALVAGLSAFTAAGLMGLAPQIARDLYADDALAPVLLACGPLTLASAAYQWVEGAMQGLRRFGQLARGGAWVAGLDLVAGVLAAWWGVVAMLTVRSVVRSAATAIAVLGWFRGPESTHSEPRACDPNQPEPTRAKLARSLLQFAGPTFAGSVVVLAGSAVVRMLLVRGGDLVQAGHFQAADSLAQGLTLVPLAAAAAFMPASAAAADRPVREVAATFRRGLDQMTGYNLALCLTLLALAPWAMTFIFGNEFAPARDALIWLVCAYGAVGPGALFVAWLMGRGRPWTIFWVNVAWVAVSLSVFWWGLVPPTAAGAAIAVMIAQWATIGLYVLIVAPLSSLPRSAYGSAIPTTFVAIAAGATLQLLPGVPAIVGVGGNLILALLVFMRFSARDLASSHPVKQWFR